MTRLWVCLIQGFILSVLSIGVLSQTCMNGATTLCQCASGYQGVYCDTDIDECASAPCVMGTCHDRVNGYTCECLPTAYGAHCEMACPCDHQQPCVRHENRVVECLCSPALQWDGPYCNTSKSSNDNSPTIPSEWSILRIAALAVSSVVVTTLIVGLVVLLRKKCLL